MNPNKINLLLIEAGFDPNALKRMDVLNNAEKFAELIIKECIKIPHIMSDISTEDAMAIEDAIKEYFYQ